MAKTLFVGRIHQDYQLIKAEDYQLILVVNFKSSSGKVTLSKSCSLCASAMFTSSNDATGKFAHLDLLIGKF